MSVTVDNKRIAFRVLPSPTTDLRGEDVGVTSSLFRSPLRRGAAVGARMRSGGGGDHPRSGREAGATRDFRRCG